MLSLAVVVHTFNPSTREAEAGGPLSSRLAWSTDQVPVQPGLHRGNPVLKTQTKQSPKNKTKQNANKQKASNVDNIGEK